MMAYIFGKAILHIKIRLLKADDRKVKAVGQPSEDKVYYF